MITTVNCIIAIIVISFCISVLIGCYLYKVLEKKHDDKIGYLESKVRMLEDRTYHTEGMFIEHMAKYH